MSVLTINRNESKVEFIITARELVMLAVHSLKKLPKSISFNIGNRIYGLTDNIFQNIIRVNSIFINNKQDVEDRHKLCNLILQDLTILENEISIIIMLYHSSLSDNEWEQWGKLIEKEKRLIRALIKSDKERTEKLK